MNGRIATQDERRSFAHAVAIQHGRFASVGSNEQIMALRGAQTKVIDLGGHLTRAVHPVEIVAGLQLLWVLKDDRYGNSD